MVLSLGIVVVGILATKDHADGSLASDPTDRRNDDNGSWAINESMSERMDVPMEHNASLSIR